jgi:hypothetical protein
VFEEYVQALANWICSLTDDRFVSSFPVGDGESADAHILGLSSLIMIEAKATRIAEPPDDYSTVKGLLDYMEKLAGARTWKDGRHRGPLEQATNLLKLWSEGDHQAEAHLGRAADWDELRYVIVVPQHLPACVHWSAFRSVGWHPRLGCPQRHLDRITSFVSIGDLEIAGAVLDKLRTSQQSKTLGELLDEWRSYWGEEHMVVTLDSRGYAEIRQGFGEYLGAQYFEVGEQHSQPPMLAEAIDALYQSVSELAFSKAEIEASRARRVRRH